MNSQNQSINVTDVGNQVVVALSLFCEIKCSYSFPYNIWLKKSILTLFTLELVIPTIESNHCFYLITESLFPLNTVFVN